MALSKKNLLLLLICLTVITACMTPKRLAKICKECPQTTETVIHDSTTVTVSTVMRDTVIRLKDSTYLRLYLRCDSLGHIQLQSSHVTQTGAITPVFSVVPETGAVSVACKFDTTGIVLRWLERNRSEVARESVKVVERVNVPYAVELTKWQRFRMDLGTGMFWLLVAALVALVVWRIIKVFNPFSAK